MKILLVSPEVVPFAKTGGLADVAGALPKALKNIGHDVRVALPKYRSIDNEKFNLRMVATEIRVKVGDGYELADIYEAKIPGTDVITYFVDNPKYFDRDGLYQDKGEDYTDNIERFTFFFFSILLFIKQKGWEPHIIHTNDWQTALIPAYLKTIYNQDPFFSRIATVYSIHNMGYQGAFKKEDMKVIGIPEEYFSMQYLEFHGKINLAKAGIVFSDILNTVSEGYKREILTPEYGCGLEGVLRNRVDDLYGILNGLDYELWDPSVDNLIRRRYNTNTISLKNENKKYLQKVQGLEQNKDIPIIGAISRLATQKGFDLIAEIIQPMMELNVGFVLLGTGEITFHILFEDIKKRYPKKFGLNLKFDATMAQQIYAGSDMFLMPSKYEPCGLGQLISFRYGVIPIVRRTGGLADTVFEYEPDTGKGNGFTFTDYRPEDLYKAVVRAVEAYKNRKNWMELQKKVMHYDFSWDRSAKTYLVLYKKALEKKNL